MRTLVHSLPLALCCAAGAAHAIPAPIPVEKLEADAQAIVEGTVVSATYLKTRTRGSYATALYKGALKIRTVIKGELKRGRSLPLYWSAESWIGKGPEPPGRGKKPAFYPCEQVRVYLWRSKDEGATRYHVSGRRLLRAPPTYTSPSDKHRTIRCVRGKPK